MMVIMIALIVNMVIIFYRMIVYIEGTQPSQQNH